MSYGLAIRTSSGLTDLDDVYTVRARGEHSLDSGTTQEILVDGVDFEYGTFSNLGISYDETTDAYFVRSFAFSFVPGQTYPDHWEEAGASQFTGLTLPQSFFLDTTSNKAVLRVIDQYWQTTNTFNSIGGGNLFYIELTIIKIKAS